MPTWIRRASSALALSVTLLVAWGLRWDAGDLMWGAWASSVTFGWAYGVLLFLSAPDEVDLPEGTASPGRFLALVGFFSLHFLLFHYAQGIFLFALFPPVREVDGTAGVLLYPAMVFPLYWPVVAATFFSSLEELREARKPSEDTERLLRPYRNIVRIQLLLFLFLTMSGLGLIRFASYPFLILYFFPVPALAGKLKSLVERLDLYMNTPR